jgi:hypothetical protein
MVTLECGECTFRSEGIEDMEHHVHAMHIYSWDEAKRYVAEWAEDAYVKHEEEEREHSLEHKRGECDCSIDRGIERDAFPHK